ncbi:MAG: hypothetical protein FD172_1920 [Methylocystaceae bacterium]|nr:MAG: hypothetical protein FD172_1920 [Methylocystaceae bacterium]
MGENLSLTLFSVEKPKGPSILNACAGSVDNETRGIAADGEAGVAVLIVDRD